MPDTFGLTFKAEKCCFVLTAEVKSSRLSSEQLCRYKRTLLVVPASAFIDGAHIGLIVLVLL
jgi:hypothetical protein